MLRLLLPLALGLLGAAGGAGAALYFAPEEAPDEVATPESLAEDASAPCGPGLSSASLEAPPEAPPTEGTTEFARMSNQFIVPVMQGGKVDALIVMSLTIEVSAGGSEAVHEREPRLRTSFLQAMFNHANSGGFEGNFTTSRNLEVLRETLLQRAREVIGPPVRDVLITEMVRQDSAG